MAKHQSSVVLHSNTVLLVMLRTCFLTDRRTLDRRVRSAFLGYRQEMHACASLGSFPVQRLAKYVPVPSRMTTCPSGPFVRSDLGMLLVGKASLQGQSRRLGGVAPLPRS